VAAVAGVHHDQAERLHRRAPRLARAAALLGPVDVEHEPVRVLQHGVLHFPRAALEHHAQHRGVAHRLEANLLHEPVADLLDAGARQGQAG
jgi:hypothetical protein